MNNGRRRGGGGGGMETRSSLRPFPVLPSAETTRVLRGQLDVDGNGAGGHEICRWSCSSPLSLPLSCLQLQPELSLLCRWWTTN